MINYLSNIFLVSLFTLLTFPTSGTENIELPAIPKGPVSIGQSLQIQEELEKES